MKHPFAVSAIFGLIAASANAQVGGTPTQDAMKAATLYSACTHPPTETPEVHEFAEQTCSAYLRGLTDGLFMMQVFAEKRHPTCLPSNTPVSVLDARRIFGDWLKMHPEAANDSAGLVAAHAIVEAYPCRGPN